MTLLAILYELMSLLHGCAAVLLFLYAINCYIMLFLHRGAWTKMLRYDEAIWKSWQADASRLPRITVQLPIYNERYVVQRLLDARQKEKKKGQ
jgi:cellulose synthase/poly-beta-1,6-N-acetylglucosamine synthase-like glycosyltransferase